MDIAQSRLQRQRLVGPGFDDPATAVAWFGAVQSQDYPGAKWALALRMPGWDSAALDEAFDAGAILRTHVMRPTWHFVAPEDIRWLLQLTGPRVQTANAHRYRQLELDEATRRRSEEIFDLFPELRENPPRIVLEHLPGEGIDSKVDELAYLALISAVIQPKIVFT